MHAPAAPIRWRDGLPRDMGLWFPGDPFAVIEVADLGDLARYLTVIGATRHRTVGSLWSL